MPPKYFFFILILGLILIISPAIIPPTVRWVTQCPDTKIAGASPGAGTEVDCVSFVTDEGRPAAGDVAGLFLPASVVRQEGG